MYLLRVLSWKRNLLGSLGYLLLIFSGREKDSRPLKINKRFLRGVCRGRVTVSRLLQGERQSRSLNSFSKRVPLNKNSYSSVGLFGRVKINSVYSPLTLRTIIFPPWSLMIERTILRPSPTPVLSSPLDLSVL